MNQMRTLLLLLIIAGLAPVRAAIQFTSVQAITNKEVLLKAVIPAGTNYRLEVSSNLITWDHWISLPGASAGLVQTDTAAPYQPARFYRGLDLPNTNSLTGDHLVTDDGDIVIHPL